MIGGMNEDDEYDLEMELRGMLNDNNNDNNNNNYPNNSNYSTGTGYGAGGTSVVVGGEVGYSMNMGSTGGVWSNYESEMAFVHKTQEGQESSLLGSSSRGGTGSRGKKRGRKPKFGGGKLLPPLSGKESEAAG